MAHINSWGCAVADSEEEFEQVCSNLGQCMSTHLEVKRDDENSHLENTPENVVAAQVGASWVKIFSRDREILLLQIHG